MEIPINVSFDLDKTLNCGQTFRWHKKNNEWLGVANGSALIFEMNKKTNLLKIQSNCEEINGENLEDAVIHYLGLNDSLQSIKGNALRQVEKSYPDFVPKFNEIVDTTIGIRLYLHNPILTQ